MKTMLVPMSEAGFAAFEREAIDDYAKQNVASGRWPAESALELSRAEHKRLLPDGLATKDAYLFEIRDSEADCAVGTLWLAVQDTTGIPSGYVYSLEVAEQHRGKGHARRAFEALETFCAGLGLSSIRLHVHEWNAPARRLYEGLGYEVTGLNMRKKLRSTGET